MRLIDADALQKEYMYEYDGKRLMLIDTAPTIEERKKGRWIKPSQDGVMSYDERAYAECSVCGKKEYLGRWKNFCPNCGADMRGGEE